MCISDKRVLLWKRCETSRPSLGIRTNNSTHNTNILMVACVTAENDDKDNAEGTTPTNGETERILPFARRRRSEVVPQVKKGTEGHHKFFQEPVTSLSVAKEREGNDVLRRPDFIDYKHRQQLDLYSRVTRRVSEPSTQKKSETSGNEMYYLNVINSCTGFTSLTRG